MRDKKLIFLVQAAAIAAVYVVLTVVGAAFAFGPVQVRFSEALTVLPYFTPAAIPGLFAGCIIANLTAGAIPLDIVFGSIATLIGALGSYALRKQKFLVPIPPIAANAVDWDRMFEIAIDPEKARAYFESCPPADRHTCSMCGKMCAVRTTNMILEGKEVKFCTEK